eukprot:g26184.t1
MLHRDWSSLSTSLWSAMLISHVISRLVLGKSLRDTFGLAEMGGSGGDAPICSARGEHRSTVEQRMQRTSEETFRTLQRSGAVRRVP